MERQQATAMGAAPAVEEEQEEEVAVVAATTAHGHDARTAVASNATSATPST